MLLLLLTFEEHHNRPSLQEHRPNTNAPVPPISQKTRSIHTPRSSSNNSHSNGAVLSEPPSVEVERTDSNDKSRCTDEELVLEASSALAAFWAHQSSSSSNVSEDLIEEQDDHMWQTEIHIVYNQWEEPRGTRYRIGGNVCYMREGMST